MANFFVNAAWGSLKPGLKKWLETRALVLPLTKKAELSRRFGVSIDVIAGVNEAMIEEADTALDTFKP